MGEARCSVPRFRRVGPAPSVTLTADDVAILRHVGRHRFIRTTDLYRLFPGRSPDRVSRRLALLYRAGFLDRPLSQLDPFRGAGSQPLVYGLDAAGARRLAALDGISVRTDSLERRNRRCTRENLDHTLAVTRFMVDVELACAARPNLTFVHAEDIIAAAPALANVAQPDRWKVSMPWRGSTADVLIAPDATFGLTYRRHDGKVLRSFFFVEIDRGSMTIAPSPEVRRSQAFLYRSSILRKLFAYAVSHRERMHHAHWGISAARVLFLTTSTSRAGEMQRVASTMVVAQTNVPAALFVFGAPAPTDDPLGYPWLDVSGATTIIAAPP